MVETPNLRPSSDWIAENAVKAVQNSGLVPSFLSIQPGYILFRQQDGGGELEYRFFHSGANVTIPREDVFRILELDMNMVDHIHRKVAEYDYVEELSNYRPNTKWRFLGIICITYLVQLIPID